MASITSIFDNFNDGSRDAIWNDDATGLGVTSESGGTLNGTPPTSNATLSTAGYLTAATSYDLTGARVFVRVPQIPNASVSHNFILKNAADTDRLQIRALSGTIDCIDRIAGVTTTLNSIAYNSTTHQWWAIRETSGTTYFEASPDGITWTAMFSLANPIVVSALGVILRTASSSSLASPGVGQWDNFNIQSVSGATAAALPVDVLAAAGSERINGTSALTDPVVAIAATGSERINGTSTLADPVVVLAGAASERINGTGAVTDPVVTLAASGSERIASSLAVTLPVDVLAALGAERINGATGLSVPVTVLLGASQETIGGASAVVLPAALMAALGSERISGMSALVVPLLIVAARTPFFWAMAMTSLERWSAETTLVEGWRATTSLTVGGSRSRTTLQGRETAETELVPL